MLRALMGLFLATLVVGCGSKPGRTAALVRGDTSTPPTAYLVPGAVIHAHFQMDPLSALTPDGDGLEVLARLAGDGLPPALDLSSSCGIATAEAIDELAVSVDEDGLLMAVRSPLDHETLRRCAMALSPDAERSRFEGRDAVRIDDMVVVFGDELTLIGSETHVRAALEAPPSAGKADPMEALGAPADAYLRVFAGIDNGLHAGGLMQLRPTDEGVEFGMSLFSLTIADADRLDHRYRMALGFMSESSSEEFKRFIPLMKRVEVRRSVGAATVVRAELPRDIEAIVRMSDLHDRVEASLIALQRIEFAEGQLRSIAEALANHVARQKENHERLRFPRSAGPTPATLPAPDGVAMTRHDWRHPTWVLLSHAIEGQVFYQYELEVHRGRRKATVRARSDLNGDGALFIVELDVEIQRDGTVEIGEIETL